MRHIIGAVFAVSVAGVAAIAATSAFLNSPLRIGPPPSTAPTTTTTPPAQTPPPAEGGAKPATPADIPEAPPRGAGAPDGAKPDAAKPTAEAEKPADEDKDDKDPYEGIAPEDLPPDLQYDADSNVSFPTNT